MEELEFLAGRGRRGATNRITGDSRVRCRRGGDESVSDCARWVAGNVRLKGSRTVEADHSYVIDW